jgi:hypothetical protein
MTPQDKRVQTIISPGSVAGPGAVITWGTDTADQVDAMGFKWEWNGRSTKRYCDNEGPNKGPNGLESLKYISPNNTLSYVLQNPAILIIDARV